MRRRRMLALGAAAGTVFGLVISDHIAAARPARPRARLLECGGFHGDEVPARTGQRWLGLFASRHGSELAFTPVRVTRFHDDIVDERPRQKTGREVSVRRRPEPIFLVRGADMLQPGPVVTVSSGERPLSHHSNIRLRLAGQEYRLQVLANRRNAEEDVPDDARLVLTHGSQRQILYDLRGKEPEEPNGWWLLWAGDLDRDGRLDLYVNVTRHYNVEERKLFLSSQAHKGRLVREIAEFVTTGC
jgi:hypothetical protein